MKRTQIYLPENLYQELKLATQRLNLSAAEIIRQAVYEKLEKSVKGKGLKTLAKIVEIGGRGPKDLATNLEYYLYGKKKR